MTCDHIADTLSKMAHRHQQDQRQEPPLSSYDLAGVAELIKAGKAQHIVVMAGAGISVSAGIPDFRTPGSGLYSQLQRYNLPWPEAVFDLRFFRHDPKPFCMLAKELWPGPHKHAPTPAHHFLRLLHDKGLLLTAFTQNIDGLEQLAGLPAHKVVNAHGSFEGAHCIDCYQPCSPYAVQAAVYDDEVPHCTSCGGLVKPDITFFGEALPAHFHRRRLADMRQADLLLVLGTSLLVQPFAGMIDQVPPHTPRVLINLKRVGEQHKKQQQQELQPQEEKQHQHPEPQEGWATNSDVSSDSSSRSSDIDGDCEVGDSASQLSALAIGCDAQQPHSPTLTACSNSTAASSSCSCCASSPGAVDGCVVVASPGCSTLQASPPTSVKAGVDAAAVALASAASGSSNCNSDDDAAAGAQRHGNAHSMANHVTSLPANGAGCNNGSGCSTDAGSKGSGFDFEGCFRDVLHLGDCDSAVMQLAELLRWQEELQALISASDAAFREARTCCEEDESC